jgi:serine O-acetyltransferase
MFEHVRSDLRRFQKAMGNCGIMRPLLFNPGLKTLMAYRLGRWLGSFARHPLRWPLMLLAPIYWTLTAYFRAAYDIRLEQSAQIGPGLLIWHFGGIRVRNCRIGEHCSIFQEVSLEPAAQDGSGPTIGDCVWIGAHARIQGALSVGDRATIGAGAVVKKDVPKGCLVLGNPARVVLRDYDNHFLM